MNVDFLQQFFLFPHNQSFWRRWAEPIHQQTDPPSPLFIRANLLLTKLKNQSTNMFPRNSCDSWLCWCPNDFPRSHPADDDHMNIHHSFTCYVFILLWFGNPSLMPRGRSGKVWRRQYGDSDNKLIIIITFFF